MSTVTILSLLLGNMPLHKTFRGELLLKLHGSLSFREGGGGRGMRENAKRTQVITKERVCGGNTGLDWNEIAKLKS